MINGGLVSNNKETMWYIIVCVIIWSLHGSSAKIITETEERSNEYKLKKTLLKGYDATTRPVTNDSEPILVRVGISLYHILNTDEKFQTIQILIFIRMRWKDAYMTWNESDYNGIKRVWIPATFLWRPDVAISNNADAQSNETPMGNIIAHSNGDVLFMRQAVSKTYCTLNVRFFPFDVQSCPITFVSWTYSGLEVDLDREENANYSYYSEMNQEWSVSNITAKRSVKKYACCPEPYPGDLKRFRDVTFMMNLKRRSTFYIFNLIFPCMLIYILSFSVFFLPVDSNEKVTMEITVLLATMVFLMVINDTLPPTPDAIPLLGLLFGTVTLIVSIAVVMAVTVTNVYYRKDLRRRVPSWARKVFLDRWMPKKKNLQESLNRSNAPMANIIEGGPIRVHPPGNSFEMITDSRGQSAVGNGPMVTRGRNDPYKRHSHTEDRLAVRPLHDSIDAHGHLHHHYLSEKAEEEWKMLAKKLDSVFFWILFISGSSVLLLLFTSIPNS